MAFNNIRVDEIRRTHVNFLSKNHHRNVLFVSFKRTQISQIEGILSLALVIEIPTIPKICGSIF
jgi:hypothetical protein